MAQETQVDLSTLTMLLTNLVTTPDDVEVTREIDEQGVLLSVKVNKNDMRIVIGRNGSMSRSIRAIMRSVGKAHGMNVRVRFLEPDGSSYTGHNTDEAKPDTSETTNSHDLNEDLKEFVINE